MRIEVDVPLEGDATQPALPTRVANEASLPNREAEIVFNLPLNEGSRAAQEAYFAGRFGAYANDVSALEDLSAVIDQARSIYEDENDPNKAADLLELTVALHPGAVRLWLALFAIYRRETMVRQYATLAQKFAASFVNDPNWPMVQQLGREIDAGNRLYAGTGVSDNSLEWEGAQQEVTDKWLGVPLDFTSLLLADELREKLLRGADQGPAPLAVAQR